MAKHVKTREFIKALTAAGATLKPGKSGHSLYLCPCGAHTLTVAANHATIAATIVNSTKTRMPCVKLTI